MGKETKPKTRGLSPLAYVVAGFLLLGAAGAWFLSRSGPGGDTLELTADAREYVRSLKLADVGMRATETYLKQLVVEIEGKITNAGERPVETVDVYCVFYDAAGQVILRERVSIVSSRLGGLKPQQTRSFRLPFDTVPESWNHQAPQIVIAGIRFSQ